MLGPVTVVDLDASASIDWSDVGLVEESGVDREAGQGGSGD